MGACQWLLECEIIGAINHLRWVEELQECGRIFIRNVFELTRHVVALVAIRAVEVHGSLRGGSEGDPSEDDIPVEHCDGSCWMKELGGCCVVGRVLSRELLSLYVTDMIAVVQGLAVLSPRSATMW
jgi:hypothetical protein